MPPSFFATIKPLRLFIFPALIACLILGVSGSSSTSRAQAPTACSYHSATADVLARTTLPRYFDWIRQLSGASPVQVSGVETSIRTRYSPQLFNGAANARAYDYLLQQVQDWHYPTAQIEEDPYVGYGQTWKNLVITIPGVVHPEQVVVLSAHLDDFSDDRYNDAPGAEDNASGVAALMEAARLFRFYQFEKTVKIIWFTGEEQGMLGSNAYMVDHPHENYLGDINLDMFGYDHDADRCLDLHVGTLAASDTLGQCFISGIASYDLNLSWDYINAAALGSSDHSSFWYHGVGAIEVLENYTRQIPGGCGGRVDVNPNYHWTTDTITNSLSSTVGFDIARAGLAAVSDLAVPLGRCFSDTPALVAWYENGTVGLDWSELQGAAAYRVLRSSHSADGPWSQLALVTASNYADAAVLGGRSYAYRIEAVVSDGACSSESSNDVLVTINGSSVFLPMVNK